jgi:hypothetical protein
MKRLLTVLAAALLMTTLIGCSSKQKTAVPTETQSLITEEPAAVGEFYPGEDQSDVTPAVFEAYPPFTEPGGAMLATSTPARIPGALEIPAPDPDFAIVHGILLSNVDNTPLHLMMVYAADKVPLEPGGGYVYSIQEKTSPHFETDAAGQFLLTKVPAGSYIMMMVTPFGSYGILNANNEEVHLDLKAGDLIDLGEVYVSWP